MKGNLNQLIIIKQNITIIFLFAYINWIVIIRIILIRLLLFIL